MLVVNYAPGTGWSALEIKAYGPLSLDPMSLFRVCPNIFEGMKAVVVLMDSLTNYSFRLGIQGTGGENRLSRPNKNMERLAPSAARAALTVSSLPLSSHLVAIGICDLSMHLP